MKKTLLSLVAFFVLALTANAEQKVCDLSALPATSESTTWDAATKTFAWTATWYNSMELFGGNDYSFYDTFNYDVEAGTADHFRIIVRFTNGAAQVTYNPAQAGKVSLTWAQMGVDADNLKAVESIRISGASDCTGNIKINSIYLEGTGAPKPTYEVPEGSTNVKALTGTNPNWASTVVYPKEFKAGGQVFGDGDGSNEATWVDVTGFETMTFQVINSSTGLALRVWMWDDVNKKVVTLYPHPEADVETADFTQEYDIKTPGKYVLKFGDLTKLKGVKAANNWTASALQVGIAYVTPPAQPAYTEYTVDAKITLNGTTETITGQVIKVNKDEEAKTLDVVLPAAELRGWSMKETTFKGIAYTVVNVFGSNIEKVANGALDGKTVTFTKGGANVVATVTSGSYASFFPSTGNYDILIKATSSIGDITVEYSNIKETTGVESVVAAPATKAAKVIENGKIVIMKGGKKFNVAGQEM